MAHLFQFAVWSVFVTIIASLSIRSTVPWVLSVTLMLMLPMVSVAVPPEHVTRYTGFSSTSPLLTTVPLGLTVFVFVVSSSFSGWQ